ncbi:MAG: sigma-70 family RNA polymerase sigma factor [Chloroflexi bacterium]|nr:sigma-70 family RNA polymerase sigma factor [Chloroflexota bacterium]
MNEYSTEVDSSQQPWERAAGRIDTVRQLLRELHAAKADLGVLLPSLVDQDAEASSRWEELQPKLELGIAEVEGAVRLADEELRALAQRDPHSTLAVDMMRFLMQRSRRSITDLQATWDGIDELLTDYVVQAELRKPTPATDSWAQWGPDADLAREQAAVVLKESRPRRPDDYILRFKYERALTQQQIAERLNLSQSTVAIRLGRVESHLAEHVGIRKVTLTMEAAGFTVTPQSPADYKLHLSCERGDESVAIYVAPSAELSSSSRGRTSTRTGRTPVHPGSLTEYDKLRRFEQMIKREAARMVPLVAIYFRKDGAVGYFTTPPVVRAVEAKSELGIDGISRDELEAFWQPEAALEAAAAAASQKGGRTMQRKK